MITSDRVIAVSSLLGAAIAALGFLFTVAELRSAREQLQAANEYQVRKDIREIVSQVVDNTFRECLLSPEDCSSDEMIRTQRSVSMLANLHVSIFEQVTATAVRDDFAAAMQEDVCNWFRFKVYDEVYSAQQSLQPDEAKDMKREWCNL